MNYSPGRRWAAARWPWWRPVLDLDRRRRRRRRRRRLPTARRSTGAASSPRHARPWPRSSRDARERSTASDTNYTHARTATTATATLWALPAGGLNTREPSLEVAPTTLSQWTRQTINKLRMCCMHVWHCPLATQNVYMSLLTCIRSLNRKNEYFSWCDPKLWLTTLTFECVLEMARLNHSAKYLGERSFRSKVIIRTHRHADTHTDQPSALPGPLTWSVITRRFLSQVAGWVLEFMTGMGQTNWRTDRQDAIRNGLKQSKILRLQTFSTIGYLHHSVLSYLTGSF